MARLTILAAFVGAVPLFAFLVVVWLTGGAPLVPIDAAAGTSGVFGQTPILEGPYGIDAAADTAAQR